MTYHLIYLDSAATSQTPDPVIEAMEAYYRTYNSNIHRGIYRISEEATAKYEEARQQISRFINARRSSQIIFTRNTTESINLVAYSWGSANLREGDEILVTVMEHHSNLLPWQLLSQRTGAKLRFIEITDEGVLQLDDLETTVDRTHQDSCNDPCLQRPRHYQSRSRTDNRCPRCRCEGTD